MARRDPLSLAGCRRQLRVAGPLNGSCFSRCQATICAWSSMSCFACRSACFRVFDSFREPLTWPFRFGVCLMPYDGRLNGGNSALPGTGTDFAARALADFTRWILPGLPDADLEAHRGAVVRRISSWAYNSRLIRERHTDEQLSALITEHWNEAGRSASRMLRYFRDELGIACEQARFSRLFARAQGGVETAS